MFWKTCAWLECQQVNFNCIQKYNIGYILK